MTSNVKNADPLLTIEEAAEYLNTTPRWIRRARAEGRLKPTKLHRGVRFKKSVLDAYIDAQTG